MKSYLSIIIFMVSLVVTSPAQVVNQVTLLPANPTATDTVYVITDFTYPGNCAFGMVYYYTTVIDSTILILPTYCGYMDTTICNSIDTFQVGLFPAGNYTIQIEFHQGSICPVSGFDATIAFFDTVVTVDAATSDQLLNGNENVIRIFPNPARDVITITIPDWKPGCEMRILNLSGQLLWKANPAQTSFQIDVSFLHQKEMYLLEIINDDYLYRTKLVMSKY